MSNPLRDVRTSPRLGDARAARRSPSTILVVDDRPDTRYVTARILTAAGYEVREAGTGRDALQLARFRPDLIVLDVVLPDLDGFEVCRRLKSDRLTHTIPIIHKTAFRCEEGDRELGFAVGADTYLTDPIGPDALVDTVRRLLQSRVHSHLIAMLLTPLPLCTSCLADRTGRRAEDVEAVISTIAATILLLIGPDICAACQTTRTTVRLAGAGPETTPRPGPNVSPSTVHRAPVRPALDAMIWRTLEARPGELLCTACLAKAIGATQRIDHALMAAEGRGAVRRFGPCAGCAKQRLLCGVER